MPWPTYSHTFVRTSKVNTWVLWTVPAHKRAVVMSVSGVDTAGSVRGTVLCRIGTVYVYDYVFLVAGGSTGTNLRLVAYQGQQVGGMFYGPAGAQGHCTVAGYMLDDPSDETTVPGTITEVPALELDPLPRPIEAPIGVRPR